LGENGECERIGSNSPMAITSKADVLEVFRIQKAPQVAYPLLCWALEDHPNLSSLIIEEFLGPSILRLAAEDLTFPAHLRLGILLQLDELMATGPGTTLVRILVSKDDLSLVELATIEMKLSYRGSPRVFLA
jgi:hypothetical protein